MITIETEGEVANRIKTELKKRIQEVLISPAPINSAAYVAAMNAHAQQMVSKFGYVHDFKYEDRGIIVKWTMDRRGNVVFLTNTGNELHAKPYRKYYGRRTKRVDAKKRLGNLILDMIFKPVTPAEFITVNFTVHKPNAIHADTPEDQG